MQYALNYSGTRFLSTEFKIITQFPGALCLKKFVTQVDSQFHSSP